MPESSAFQRACLSDLVFLVIVIILLISGIATRNVLVTL